MDVGAMSSIEAMDDCAVEMDVETTGVMLAAAAIAAAARAAEPAEVAVVTAAAGSSDADHEAAVVLDGLGCASFGPLGAARGGTG